MKTVDSLIALRDLGDAVAAQELHDLAERRVRAWMAAWPSELAEMTFTEEQRFRLARALLAQILFGWIP